MSRDGEAKRDSLVPPGEQAPRQVAEHVLVLVLRPAIVASQDEVLLTHRRGLEHVVQHRDDGVGVLRQRAALPTDLGSVKAVIICIIVVIVDLDFLALLALCVALGCSLVVLG